MKIIEGNFGKKNSAPETKTVFQRVFDVEDINSYEIGLAIATRQEDGMVLFSCNVGMPELYILLDQIKMYILSGEDYEQDPPH
jgi:hypothetical protein